MLDCIISFLAIAAFWGMVCGVWLGMALVFVSFQGKGY